MKLFCECMKDAGVSQVHAPGTIGTRGKKRRPKKSDWNQRRIDQDSAGDPDQMSAQTPSPDLSDIEDDDGDEQTVSAKNWSIPLDVIKADADQHLIFGWASVVEKDGKAIIDKQGDIIPVAELENAAYEFALNSRAGGDMHNRMGVAKLVESMVFTKEKQAALGIDLGQVGWWVGFKVHDKELWAAHKRGERPEFSIGGAAIPVEVEKGQRGRRIARAPFRY
jgi:hypothetical protein